MLYCNVDEICRADGRCGSASWAKYDSCSIRSSHRYNKVKLALGLIDYVIGEKGEWVCIFTHSWPRYSAEVALLPVKCPLYRLHMRLCATPRRSGRCRERKSLLSLSRFDPPQFGGRPARNVVTTQTMLSPHVSHLSCLYGSIIGAVQLRPLHGAV
jgi:hypothetical protein